MKRKLGEVSVCNRGGWVPGPMIGKGGFCSVYLSTNTNPSYPPVMAVKSTPFSHSIDLLKEKWLLSNLRGCPNIIQCFCDDVTKTDNGDMIFILFLEYASGGTLDDLIEKSNGHGLPEVSVRRYTRSILEGLRHVHEGNIVHCDLKPENILLVPYATGCGTEFIPKIGDFGLSKRVKRRKDDNLRGTPLYLSPEAVVHQVQEQPSDIWALGCVVVKMLTGKPAWDTKPGSKIVDLMFRIGSKHESPVIPSDISAEGKDFLRCCFARNPEDRLTAAGLLNHPFISKLDEVDGMCEVSTSDKEIGPLCSEDDDCFIPLEDSSSAGLEELDVSCETGFDIIPKAIMHSSYFKPALPHTTWQRPYGLVVPAGV